MGHAFCTAARLNSAYDIPVSLFAGLSEPLCEIRFGGLWHRLTCSVELLICTSNCGWPLPEAVSRGHPACSIAVHKRTAFSAGSYLGLLRLCSS